MPFTFSHPALILPFLKKNWFSTTGLFVGSIVPDFEYFFKMAKGNTFFSHNLLSLLYFNLPVGILLCFWFHYIIRDPLIAHLPGKLNQRFSPCLSFQWSSYFAKNWKSVASSIILGALTHLGWDWLTHASADYLYFHQDKLFWFSSWKHHSFIYAINHFTHSFLGLAVILFLVNSLPLSKKEHRSKHIAMFWTSSLMVTIFIFCIRLLSSSQLTFNDKVAAFIASFLLALTLICLFFRKPRKLE